MEIAAKFNSKLKLALKNLAAEHSLPYQELRIVITPRKLPEPTGVLNEEIYLTYELYHKTFKICDLRFDKIIKLDVMESMFVDENKVAKFIISTLVKMSIGAVCSLTALKVMIFETDNIKLKLIKDGCIINEFDVDKLF